MKKPTSMAKRLAEAERLADIRLHHATEDFRRCCELAIKLDINNAVLRVQAEKIAALEAQLAKRRKRK